MIASYLASADRRPGVRRARRARPARPPRRRLRATPSRSTPTSPATPTSPSAARCCSASASRRTSTRPYRALLDPGLLAALAHDAVALAARLPLHPARRQPRRRARRRTATCSSRWCSAGSGTARAWTFVVWGALHGTYLVTERWVKERWAAQPRPAGAARARSPRSCSGCSPSTWCAWRGSSSGPTPSAPPST